MTALIGSFVCVFLIVCMAIFVWVLSKPEELNEELRAMMMRSAHYGDARD